AIAAGPAPLRARTAAGSAGGSLSAWDFGVTDLTFKADRGEFWCLDGHSDSVPTVAAFQASDLSVPPASVRLALPPGFEAAKALGLAEIPRGALRGKNLVLLDANFAARASGTNVPQEAYFAIFDDAGSLVPEGVPAKAVGIREDAVLTTIAINPERDEIAAYDVKGHRVCFLDFSFAATGAELPLLGSSTFFGEFWRLGSVWRSSGVGIAYRGPDTLVATSALYNIFEAHFALEYDLSAGGAYTGRAVDLSAAALPSLDLCFLGLAFGETAGDEVFAAVNYADDAVYLFDAEFAPEPAPPTITACGRIADGRYVVFWSPPATGGLDSVRIFENGVQVAVLPPTAASYESQLPLMGKAFVEVAVETEGTVSDLRAVCQLEDADVPPLPNVAYMATQIGDRQGILGIAATKLPATPDDFRLYVLGRDSNKVTVLDYRLDALPSLELKPFQASADTRRNLAARGVAIVKIGDQDHLAVLDPDGPAGTGPPSAAFYALGGPSPGEMTLKVDVVDLTRLPVSPYILDWDADLEGNLIAGGQVGQDYVLVKIVFDGASLVAVDAVEIPHRLLTPYADRAVTGIGVAVLPNGNILVAGSDTFSETYTEALLLTPWTEGSDRSARFVGYAQGLVVSSQFRIFTKPIGPGIGPAYVSGLDVAYFGSAGPGGVGVGVAYLSTPDILLVRNSAGSLNGPGNLVIHSTTRCPHPHFRADQLLDEPVEVPAGGAHRTGPLSPAFGEGEAGTDYYVYVLNRSTTEPADLEIEIVLEGAGAPEGPATVAVPPGRYYRAALLAREARDVEVVLRNLGGRPVPLEILAGATGLREVQAVQFRRGDVDGSGAPNLSDAIFGLNWLFLGGREPACQDAADVDDSGTVNLSDMVSLLLHLFLSGDPPAPPGLEVCGQDPTEDDLPACLYEASCS
ncbi:MAG: hypothetical protein ACUVYA_16150, partial [Planctomycetota bacterium]